jgi:hypothetical protein
MFDLTGVQFIDVRPAAQSADVRRNRLWMRDECGLP